MGSSSANTIHQFKSPPRTAPSTRRQPSRQVHTIVTMKLRVLVLRTVCAVMGLTMTAACTAQEWHTMTFRADPPGVDEGPLRGFVPYSSTRQGPDTFPHSMEWFYLPLSDVVTGPDTYDWTALEKELTAISGRGHQAVFRFYVDYPKKPSGIPQYLLGAGLKTFPYDDSDNAKSSTPSGALHPRIRREIRRRSTHRLHHRRPLRILGRVARAQASSARRALRLGHCAKGQGRPAAGLRGELSPYPA